MQMIRRRKMSKLNIRTDLAIESHEMMGGSSENSDISGVKVDVDEDLENKILTTWVEVLNEQGSKEMGKPIGKYVTIESQAMKENDVFAEEIITTTLSKKLMKLKALDEKDTILIVGLGNWNVTPDALGPKVVSKVLVTRHILESLPEKIDKSVRTVCAISPGVMGLTGIETGEIVKGVVEKVKPNIVIAIDALAARKSSRVNTTIQMSDTGIAPGAGVHNNRMMLNEDSLGVPVIAIGVPTVVDAATLVNDTMDIMLQEISKEADGSEFYNMLSDLELEDKYGLIKEVLNPYVGNMFVTPKDIDAVIERLAKIIANALNIALHPGIDSNDINRYLN